MLVAGLWIEAAALAETPEHSAAEHCGCRVPAAAPRCSATPSAGHVAQRSV